jgi:hypothetical protein
MGQLMPEGAIDLHRIVVSEPRIQGDELPAGIGAPSGTEESRVPFHVNLPAELLGIERAQDFACLRFERRVATEDNERRRRGENEVQLLTAGRLIQLQGTAI